MNPILSEVQSTQGINSCGNVILLYEAWCISTTPERNIDRRAPSRYRGRAALTAEMLAMAVEA